MFELDGTKSGPIDHGIIMNTSLLNVSTFCAMSPNVILIAINFNQAAAEKIKETYIQPNPDVLEFSMIGLTPPPEW